MNKEIILKARELVNTDNKIKKFYFIPGLISIIFLMFLLVYQVIYTYVELFHKQDKALSVLLSIFHSEYFTWIMIVIVIFILIYIIIMPIFEWSLIWYISKKETAETQVSISDSLWKGLYRFLPLFEYGNIFSQFKFLSMINSYLFCLRFIGVEYITLLNYVFIFLLWVSSIVNILFVYCRFEIVLNNKKALESLSNSIKIAILNFATTTRIYFFLFLVNIRVILNFLVFLFFPILIASALTYITTKIYLVITIGFLSIIFIILIWVLGYLWWVFEILKTAIWYNAYKEGKEKLEELWDTKE